MNNSLESHRLFPHVAWFLIIGFAILTYSLTVRLQQEMSGLATNMDELENRVNAIETTQPVTP
jgi:hypothetical protein